MTWVELRVVLLDQDAATTARLTRLLDQEESRRAAAFHFERDRARWITGRAALRLLLGHHLAMPAEEVPIARDDNGKPFLRGHPVHFNLSHADDLALIAITLASPVGVDLERFERGAELTQCLDTFCSISEKHHINSLPEITDKHRALIRTWCAKEAFLKALGTGLAVPPERLTVAWQSGGSARIHRSQIREPAWEIHFPEGLSGFCAAVALPLGVACPAIFTFEVCDQ